MKLYVYDEIKNEIHKYEKNMLLKYLNLVVVKDEDFGNIKLENHQMGYSIKFSQQEEKFLIEAVGEKNIINNNVNIYTPFLLINFLEDKYGQNYAIKLSNGIFYIKDKKIKIENESFLIKNNLVKYIQFENAVFILQPEENYKLNL